MAKPLKSILNWVAKHFSEDASKMLVWTGVAGWTLSSIAQVGAILFNSKISNDQKSFLVPQEMADAAVNIASFFLFTQFTRKTVSKLFSTGKFASKSVRKFLDKNKELYSQKIGKFDFNLDEVLNKHIDFPKDEYYTCKNFSKTLATVGAGIISSNIVTPIVRNRMASNMQKNYLDRKQNSVNPYKSSGMRV